MQLDVRPRQAGKTTDAIKRAAERWLYIVVINKQEQRRVFEEAKRMGLDIPFPITFEEFTRGQFGRGIRGFIIDNLDMCLLQAARAIPIEVVTWSEQGGE
jgi:hypothetical protein